MKDRVLFKFVVLGSTGCGKTALVNRFAKSSFSKEYKPTVGGDFAEKRVRTKIQDEDTAYHVQLRDCSGDERYKRFISNYSINADAFIVAFDLTDSASFESAKRQIEELQENSADTPIILVGTKSDLTSQIDVSDETIKQFNQDNKYHYVATSAKEGTNVDQLFMGGLQRVGKRAEVQNQVELDTTNNPDDTEINKKEAIDKLHLLCVSYAGHLVHQTKNPDMVSKKLVLILKMQDALQGEDKTNHEKLTAFSELFTEENKQMLAKHRDTGSVRFMAGAVRVLTLVGMFIPKLGSMSFWKSHGEIFNEKANDLTTPIKPK